MTKKSVFFLLLVTLLSCLTACGADDAADHTTSVLQREDPHIVSVKEGSPVSYPDKTYGDAFDAFFASPSWKYFKGSDDDSDETYDVVEFTGYCTYQEVEVKARLQFTLDLDNGSFETTYLSFNDVPQNMLMLAALMDVVFSNEDSQTATANDSSAGTSNDDTLPALPIDTSYPYGYYEKNGGGALDIGYTTDESQLIYFRFYKDRVEGYYGGSWLQEEDYAAYFDLSTFDVTASTWNLTIDNTQVDVFISSSAMTVTAYGPLGNLSAEQISGVYYCKEQAIEP